MTSISDEIIERFVVVYGEPKTSHVERFLAEYARSMDGYDVTALRQAADRIIRTCTFWPKPAELLAEVEKILAESSRHRKPEAYEAHHDPTPEERARVRVMLDGFRKFMEGNVTVSDAEIRDQLAEEFRKVQRPGFEAIRRGLTQTSRRMTGEHSE